MTTISEYEARERYGSTEYSLQLGGLNNARQKAAGISHGMRATQQLPACCSQLGALYKIQLNNENIRYWIPHL